MSIPTISRWLAADRRDGLAGVLKRRTKHNHRPRKIDQEVVDYLERGFQAERWNTLMQAKDELYSRASRFVQNRSGIGACLRIA